jgi:benzoyl-CoA reductase/2-hydroxyglutaryl-CoA dehydratase subunit BcrC/BadD/HgdB
VDNKIYNDFLVLAGFENDEIPQILPEWIEASKKLGLSEEDVRFATEQFIPQNWDIELKGIRKLIGAAIREVIDLTKANDYKKNGVKIVYGIMPAIVTNYMAIKLSGGDNVFVSFPDLHIVSALNSFFHKASPYYERAEEAGMTYGCRHCALNKTRVASILEGVIPSPDIIWSWGFNCDEGPKIDEYINCYCDPNWEVVVTRIPHDTHFGEIDDEIPERVDFLAKQMGYGQDYVEKITGITVTPESLSESVKAWSRYAFKVGQLNAIANSADPLPISGTELSIFGQPMFAPYNTGLKYMEEALDITIKEVRERVKNCIGVSPKGAPKVGCYFVPFVVPWINKMFLENEVGLTFSFMMTLTKKQLQPPSYEDPFKAAAEQWLRMPMGQNMGQEIDGMIEKVEAYKPDAMLMGFFDFDRWLGAHHKMAAQLIEEKTEIPHFYIEADFWDDRDYSPEALRTRIESISQVVKMNKIIK